MTRDELISRTRQLIDEGDRLLAQPSMGAMQLWLQLSDDLLATAWGSMDRYHLAWLMVGKPKSIVRGRPMTRRRGGRLRPRGRDAEDRGAADVARRRRRQGMPFVGETGGGLGQGRTTDRSEPGVDDRPPPVADRAPDRPACRRTRRSPIGSRRPAAGPRPIATTRRRALHAPTACSGDRGPRPGGRRRRDRDGAGTRSGRQRLPAARRFGWTSTSPASSTGTSGRPSSRRRSTWSSSARRRASRETRSALRDRLAAEVARARPARLARRPAGRARDAGRGARRRAAAVPRARRRAAWRSRRRAAGRRVFDAAAARHRRPAARRRARSRTGSPPGTTARGPGRPRCRPSSTGSSRGSGRGPRRLSACPTARTCGSRSSPTSRGRATTGTTAAGVRGSTSTPTCRSAPPTSSARSPTRRTRATTSSTPGRRPTSSTTRGRLEASILLINTPECLDQRGSRRPRHGVRVAAATSGRPARRAVRAGRPGDRRRPGRARETRRACGRHRRPRARPRRDPRERRAPAPRRRPVARRGRSPTSRDVGRLRRPIGRQAARVHRAPAVADLRLRLRRGRGAPPPLARGGPGPRSAARFGRLLHEQLDAGSILAELG